MLRKIILTISAVAVAIAAGHTEARAGARVERLRHSFTERGTRIVLDLSATTRYDITSVRNPERIAINLRGATASRGLGTLNVGEGAVNKVRINRLSWGTQVVIDLKGRAEWKHFALPGGSGRPDRIVVDVAGLVSETPAPEVASRGTVRRSSDAGRRLTIIAIDAGHGGHDPGTRGRYGLVEKRLTLDMARRVRRLINAQDGFKAVLTRSDDKYLDLDKRLDRARELNADAFVSLHFNWARNSSARGCEVYFVHPTGVRKSAAELLHNPRRAASEYGIDRSASSDLLHMLVDMNEQSVLERSESLAASILNNFGGSGMPPQRAVKQRSFQVLRHIAMPAVLVESGYLSNTSDADIIRTEPGRERIARAVSNGIVAYLSEDPPLRRSGDAVTVHKVRRGDTLWKISRLYGTPISDLRRVNNLGKKSVLHVGQELVVSRGF